MELNINIVNLLILLIYLIAVVSAYKNGFLYEVLGLFINLLILFLAFLGAPLFSRNFPLINIDVQAYPILSIFNVNELFNTILYFVLIYLVLSIIGFLIKRLFKSVSDIPFLGFFNQVLGMVVGFINATIITLLLSLLVSLPFISNGQAIKQQSLLKYVNMFSNQAVLYISDYIDLESLAIDIDNFDAENAREELNKWLIEQGVFHE